MVSLVSARVIRALPPAPSLRMHQSLLDDHVDKHLPPATAAATIAAVLILILHHDLSRASAAFTVLGIVCTAGIIAISATLVRRENQQIQQWVDGSPTEPYAQARRDWDRAQGLRTVFGAAALASYIIGALA
jgi:hypothetical protein